jgi:L-rhamnose mutarotase
MKRYGHLIRIEPDQITEYKRIHAAVWPDVLAQIERSNIRNYTIFLREPENLLFAYYEYVGTDHDADMAEMARDTRTQEWWKITEPMQTPLPTKTSGEWWVGMEEVFHTD